MNYKALAEKTQTRYIKSRHTLESSNFSFDLKTLEAYSYSWWRFTKPLGDYIIFSNYSYSKSTSRHQLKAKRILGELGYKNVIMLDYVSGIDCPVDALKLEIAEIKNEINNLRELINKKGTHKKTNRKRIDTIAKLVYKQYRLIQVLLSEGKNNE
jgi:hypothetical protein